MNADTPSGPEPVRRWRILAGERRLIVDDRPVTVGGRAFDVLQALLARRGRVVSKATLMKAAWPDRVVEDNNLSVQIAGLRSVLGRNAIETIAGVGYQLCSAPEDDDAPDDEVPQPRERPRRAASLPPPPRLFGRDGDVQAIVAKAMDAALVSVVGTGGVGKTAIAKVVAAALAGRDPRPIHWIDLTPVRDGTQFAVLVAKALAIEFRPEEQSVSALLEALGPIEARFVVDNCEHVVDEVADFIGRAMHHIPSIRWLTTSQASLDLTGEVVYRLRPLPVPRVGMTLAEARDNGAIALFLERTTNANHHFLLGLDNLSTAIDLCRQVEGLPLAIEMAAARTAGLGLDVAREQIEERMQLAKARRGSGGRHDTLRGTFDWSYELLTSDERRVFRRLQPFAGGFGLAMAEEVAGLGEDAVDRRDGSFVEAFTVLVDKSLVQTSDESSRRYFLFESAREYACERLVAESEEALVRRRHAEAVALFFAPARDDLERMSDARWAGLYGVERNNVIAALEWVCGAQEPEPDLLARLVAALAQMDMLLRIPYAVLRFAPPLGVLRRARPALRAVAFTELAWAYYADGDRKIATELARSALEDFETIGDRPGVHVALTQLIRLYEGRPGMEAEARRLWDRLEAMDRRDLPLRTRLFCEITGGMRYVGDRTPALLQQWRATALTAGFDSLAALCEVWTSDELLIHRRYDEVVELAEGFLAGDQSRLRLRGTMLINLVLALVQLRRGDEAVEVARNAFRVLPGRAHLLLIAIALDAAREGRHVDAALMMGHCERVRVGHDEMFDPAEADAARETTTLLVAALGQDRFRELMDVGGTMPLPDFFATRRTSVSAPMAGPTSGDAGRSSSHDGA